MKRLLVVTVLLTSSFARGGMAAEGLSSLIRDYRDAKKAGGGAKERAQTAERLQPLLEKIAAAGTDEAVAFLLGELDSAPPEIAASCARAVVLSKSSPGIARVLGGFQKRAPAVHEAVLQALAATDLDLKPLQGELLAAAAAVKGAQARPLVPPVLSKLGTKEAVRTLIALAGEPAKAGASDPYTDAVVNALKRSSSDDVKTWLARDAFTACRGETPRLLIVARLAGELRLEARKELEGLLDHASEELAAAAAESIASLGAEPSAAKLVAAFERRRAKADLGLKVRFLDAIAGAGTARSTEFVSGLLHDKDPALRAVAVGSLALTTDPRGLTGLLEGLKDAEPSVRSLTLEALKARRDKTMIGHLIEYLGTEKDPRLKLDALRFLVRLTGLNMEFSVPDWKKWWAAEEARFTFPDENETAKGATNVRLAKAGEVTPSYFGLEIASSKKIAFLVDASTSMKESVPVRTGKDGEAGGKAQKMQVLKKELTQVLEKLPANTSLNLIAFSAGYRPWKDQLQPLTGNGRANAITFVKNLGMSSGTNVFDTLELALKDRQVDTIYLLTDGLPTAGRITEPGAIAREVKLLNRARGAVIHCIAFGEESQLLKDLAAQNRGEYRFVNEY